MNEEDIRGSCYRDLYSSPGKYFGEIKNETSVISTVDEIVNSVPRPLRLFPPSPPLIVTGFRGPHEPHS